jgi:serine/threonine protein kinase
MALTTGDRLGNYEIVALLGHGGMGEVYRARDTRLGREVAIKILPAAFANDPNRLARLEREARLISQVNHPNVCTLFQIGDASEPHETHFLVLELVEGETLQQRLIRGPLHVREALRYAADIAAALEAAHARGIIHRDLKPSNIKITAGRTVKVLDFGVAKLAEGLDDGLHGSPLLTATLGGTREGALVGTVAYISPEQAMGDSVDKRADIWSFGCVLYEMLTAERAFPGLAIADTLANVMRGEPNWAILPESTPPPIRKLLARCLEKDRGRRLADIADARLEIDEALSASSVAAPVGPAHRKGRSGFRTMLAFASGIVVTVMVLGAFDFFRDRRDEEPPPRSDIAVNPVAPSSSQPSSSPASTPPDPPTSAAPAARAPAVRTPRVATRSSINPAGGVTWAPSLARGIANTVLAISPDGRHVVYSGLDGETAELWLQTLDGSAPRQLPGTGGASSPFWSPDGASVGFFAAGSLKRVDLSPNSRPVTLCAVSNPRGGTWGPDDTIVFAGYPGRPLAQISAKGGETTFLTRLEAGEPHHVRPHFLAGSRRLLYRVTGPNQRNNAYYAMTLGSPERKLLMRVDSGNVMYAAGHLLFVQHGALMAQRFDPTTLSVIGEPLLIVDRIRLSMDTPPRFGIFSVSRRGVLAYLPDGGGNVPMTILSNWADLVK